jgi:hypothetical protein
MMLGTQKSTSILTEGAMSEVDEVLAALRARDIRLMADGDQLHYDAPAGVVTPEVATLLRQHKTALLALLTAPAPTVVSSPEPLTQYYPCVVCGKTERWDDHGIWRCVACWPP